MCLHITLIYDTVGRSVDHSSNSHYASSREMYQVIINFVTMVHHVVKYKPKINVVLLTSKG